MSVSNISTILQKSRTPFGSFVGNNYDHDSQERITFLRELNIKPRHSHQHGMNTPTNNNNNNTSSPPSITDRTPSNLLEFKQQRLLEAADRKKRLITRIITVVGLLIILLCAAIVTLTLKMAPKIDELVRSKTGTHQSIHLMSRMTTPLTTTITIELNNSTTNNSLITKSIFRTRRRSFI
jgi:hypothetical protein